MFQPTNQYPDAEAIHLFREGGGWLARSESHRAIFGADAVPTPWLDTMRASQVLATIRALNPGVIVTVEAA